MRPFPGEEERTAEVAKELHGLLNVAESLHNFWLTHPKDEWIQKSKLSSRVVNVAVMLDIQASRLFRAAIEECRRADAYAANILTRTLFETVLALRFLLAGEDLRIAVEQAKTKKGKAPKVDDAGKPVYCSKIPTPSMPEALIHLLTREKRADLFLAHAFFQDVRSSEKLTAFPGIEENVRKLQAGAAASIASYEKEIGVEWSSILHNSHEFSGMNVETLAKLMGKPFEQWYDAIYHLQSINVHAGGSIRNIHIKDDQKLQAAFVSSVSEVRQVLPTSITMFFIAIDTIHEAVGYGPDVDHAYASIKRRYEAQMKT
jgi:hypothetical protein